MSNVDPRRLVQKLWNYCDVLRDDGVSTIDYVEQLTYLLFLKMADERARRPLKPEQIVPADLSWQTLLDSDGVRLEVQYRNILSGLGQESGTLGTIFRKAQNKIQDPAKLKKLIVDLIDKEQWSQAGVDVKGDAYEELLAKGAEDAKSGAGQYFTPRALIEAIVDCVQPTPDDTITDPACGTGGFLLSAYDYIQRHHGDSLTRDQARHLANGGIFGTELVDGTARLAAMNMLLHGIGTPSGPSLIDVRDSLGREPSSKVSLVLANPPFGRSSSIRMIGEDGRASREEREIERADFWATTSNKQLNFVQHIASMLEIDGRAAVVLPDNVLFEGGAGETIRRRLLKQYDLHTMLRLPTGIFYAGGVKANVLFFRARARPRGAVDQQALGVRLPHQPALHAQAEPAAPGAPAGVRRLLPAGQGPGRAGGERAVPGVRLRRAAEPRQGQPGHHLAEGRLAGGRRRAAATRGHRPGDRRRPTSRPTRVRRHRRHAVHSVGLQSR
ncbi:type I restriction-modification system subunit M [Micromonospora sp. LOL_027]|uniref:type I restriction-modification system subunit M n=1 Tax=Micromonospora sp. LOL_027 TaxID=3345419 RepID=UPI003A89A1DD